MYIYIHFWYYMMLYVYVYIYICIYTQLYKWIFPITDLPGHSVKPQDLGALGAAAAAVFPMASEKAGLRGSQRMVLR